ncbi:MAG: transketolase family protein [Chloroflexota bacterium]|nr:MAG: transketolase [Chloroflexota bacterium]
MIDSELTAARNTRSMPFGAALVEVGRRREDIVVLSADLAKYTDIAPYVEMFPDRFFQIGMAEQNMMGIAGGLWRSGFAPWVTTYGVFATRRAYDQIAIALALGRADVKIIAFLPGLTTNGGPTHQAIEDLATMRALPNMVVVDPADAVEITQAVEALAEYRGPVYMRGLRGQVPVFLPDGYRFEIGKARMLQEGSDVGIISTGLMLEYALDAADELARQGVSAAVLHVSTLKPFDGKAVLSLARDVPALVTAENHTTIGGLGGAVAQELAVAGLQRPLRLCGVQDRFAEAGMPPYLFRRYGLTAAHIVELATEARDAAKCSGAAEGDHATS